MAGSFANIQSNNIVPGVRHELMQTEDSATFNKQYTDIHGRKSLRISLIRDNSNGTDTTSNRDNVLHVAVRDESKGDSVHSHDAPSDDDEFPPDDDDDDDADSIDLDTIKKEITEEQQLECSRREKPKSNSLKLSLVKDEIIIIDSEILDETEDIKPEISTLDAADVIEKNRVCATDAPASLIPKTEKADAFVASAQYADGTAVNITMIAPVSNSINFDEEHESSRRLKARNKRQNSASRQIEDSVAPVYWEALGEDGIKSEECLPENMDVKAIIEQITGRISNSLSQEAEELARDTLECCANLSVDTCTSSKDDSDQSIIKRNLKRKILGQPQPLIVQPKPMCTRVTNIPIPGRTGSTNQCIMKVPKNCVPALLKQQVNTCTTNALQKFVTVWVPYQNLPPDQDRSVKMNINPTDGTCKLTGASGQSVGGKLYLKHTTEAENANPSEENSEIITEQSSMTADTEIPSIVECPLCKKTCTNSELSLHMSDCHKELGEHVISLKIKHPKLATLLGEPQVASSEICTISTDLSDEEHIVSHPDQVDDSIMERLEQELDSITRERPDDAIVCYVGDSQSSQNSCHTGVVLKSEVEDRPVAGDTPVSMITEVQEAGEKHISNSDDQSKNLHESPPLKQSTDMLDCEPNSTTSETIVDKAISLSTSCASLPDKESHDQNVCPSSEASGYIDIELHKSISSVPVTEKQTISVSEDIPEPVFSVMEEPCTIHVSDTLQSSEMNSAHSPASGDVEQNKGDSTSCETDECILQPTHDEESIGILQPSSDSSHDTEVSEAIEQSAPQSEDVSESDSLLEQNSEANSAVNEANEREMISIANCASSETNDNDDTNSSNETSNTKSSSNQDDVGNSNSIEDLANMIYQYISAGVADEKTLSAAMDSVVDVPKKSNSPVTSGSSQPAVLPTEKLPVQFMDNDGYIYVRLGPGLKPQPRVSSPSINSESCQDQSADVIDCSKLQNADIVPEPELPDLSKDGAANVVGTSIVKEEPDQITYDDDIVEVGAETLICESQDSPIDVVNDADFQDLSTRGSESPGRIQIKLSKSAPSLAAPAISESGMCQIKQQWLSILQTHWPTRVVCHVCGKVFGGRVFEEHILTHSHIRSYECPKCFINTSSLTYFQKHIKLHEETFEIPFCCLLCGSSYSGLAYYNLHMKKHRERRLNLERVEYEQQLLDAEKNEKAESNLLAIKTEVPIYSREGGERDANDKIFMLQSDMIQDIGQNLSERMKPKKAGTWKTEFTCDFCGKVFTRTRLFNKHLLEHKSTEKDIKAHNSVSLNHPVPTYSPGSAEDKARLLCFIRQKHAYSSVPVEMKGMSFDKESSVYSVMHDQSGMSVEASGGSQPQDHSVKVNEADTTPESDVGTQALESSSNNEEENIDIKEEKQPAGKSKRVRYTCHICNKVYMAKRQINKHLIEHYLEQNLPGKSYVCSLCEFTTDNLFALARHEQIHVELKRKDAKSDTGISDDDGRDTDDGRKLSAKLAKNVNPRRSPRKSRSDLLSVTGSIATQSKHNVTAATSVKTDSPVRMSSRIKSRASFKRYSSSSDDERDIRPEKYTPSPKNKMSVSPGKKFVLSTQKTHSPSKQRSFILVKADSSSSASFSLSRRKPTLPLKRKSTVPSEESDSSLRNSDADFVLFSPLKSSSNQLEITHTSPPSKQARLFGIINGKTNTCKSIDSVTESLENVDTERCADDGEASNIKPERVIILRDRRKLENRNNPIKTIQLKIGHEQMKKKKQGSKREISSDDLNAVEGLMMMSLRQEDGSSSPSSSKGSSSKNTEHMKSKDKMAATKSKEEIPKKKLAHKATEVTISYKKLTDDVPVTSVSGDGETLDSGDADAQPSSFLDQINSMLDASKQINEQPAEYDETMNGVVAEIVEVSSSNANIAHIHINESPTTLQFKSFVDLLKEKLAIECDDGYGYKCGICNKEYKNKCTIRTHLRSHSIREIKTCEFCGKNFVNACTYEEHRRIHTNEKPYSCDLCGRSFGHRLSLKAHKIAHTTERPYKCGYCNKSFKRESYLSIHVKIHTGERPYQCNLCSKSFTHSQSLKIHLKTHARHLASGDVKQRDRYQDLNVPEHEQGLMTYNMLTDAWNLNNASASTQFTVQELHPYATNSLPL